MTSFAPRQGIAVSLWTMKTLPSGHRPVIAAGVALWLVRPITSTAKTGVKERSFGIWSILTVSHILQGEVTQNQLDRVNFST